MKTIIRTMMALAIAAFTFTACEDVPEPYLTPTPSNGDNPQEEGIATGDGTLENPFNAIAATNAAKELGSGNVSEQMYYIKGKVVSIATDKNGNVLNFDQGTYGNASFYISDDGTSTNQFYCYRVLYLGNKKWTQGAGDILKEGDEVIVCAKITMYNTTPETQQNEGFLYSLNGKSEGGAPQEDTGTPAGDGSQQNPFNIAAAIAKCKEIGESPSTEKYYVKGIAVSEGVPDASFGNATFDMADTADGTSKFKAYQVLGTNGVKMPTTCKIPVGAEVIVYGPIYNFKNNTPETEGKGAAYIVSVNGKSTEELNGGGGGGGNTPTGEAKGSGTEADPYNVIAAIQFAQSLGADVESANDVYVTGIISSIKYTYSSQYGTATYSISVDGKASNEFIVYGSYYLNNQPWKDGDTQIQIGDEVVACGKVVNYKGDTPEFANKKNWLVSIKSNGGGNGGGNEGGGEGGEVSGNTISVDFSSLGLSNQQKPSTLTLSDGTTLTFDAGGNTNAPAYYNTGTALRIYPKNTMAINAGSKKIAAIEIVCDEYQGTLYNASGDITVNDAKMTIDGTSLKYTGPNASTANVANTSSTTGAASQLRMKTLKITYAE